MTPAIQNITFLISFGTLLLGIAVLILLIIFIFLGKNLTGKIKKLVNFVSDKALWLGFLVSLLGFLLSLFYSEIAKLPPCEFCWWQRILLYPQVIIFAVAIYFEKKGKDVRQSLVIAQIFSMIGVLVAGYQYFAQMFLPGLLSACGASSVSCATLYFKSFGFITIPAMSLTAFIAVVVLISVRQIYPKNK